MAKGSTTCRGDLRRQRPIGARASVRRFQIGYDVMAGLYRVFPISAMQIPRPQKVQEVLEVLLARLQPWWGEIDVKSYEEEESRHCAMVPSHRDRELGWKDMERELGGGHLASGHTWQFMVSRAAEESTSELCGYSGTCQVVFGG